VQLYAATLASYPDNVEARANLASVYLDRAEHARASALLGESLALAPHDPMLLHLQLELLLRTGRAADALALWRAHLELLDAASDGLRLGQLLDQAGQPHDAAQAYRAALALALTPEERRFASYSLLSSLILAQRTGEARALVEQLLRADPDDPKLQLAQRLLNTRTP